MGATVHSHMAVESVCKKNFSPSPSKVKFVLGGKRINEFIGGKRINEFIV